MTPTVCVVVPCRNMGRYVGEAIESALTQSHAPAEVVVVDDGSTDNSAKILESFGSAIRVLNGPGAGVAIARNLAILNSSSDYVTFLDADDAWFRQKLELQLSQLQRDGVSSHFSFTDYVRGPDLAHASEPILPLYKHVTEGEVFSPLLRENFVLTSSVMVSRYALGRVGLFDPNMMGTEDYDLWLRLARVFPFCWQRQPLVFYRRHAEAITQSRTYIYHQANMWESLAHQYRRIDSQNRSFIRMSVAQSSYVAGRLAVELGEFDQARNQFDRARLFGAPWIKSTFWSLISRLPNGATRFLQRTWLRSKAAVRREAGK